MTAPTNNRTVYTIAEREGTRSVWTRIGTAWDNQDGSITVRLDALPLNGILRVGDPASTQVAEVKR